VAVVTACAQAFEYVGLPEGQFHLAEAALYLATAPKSNTTLAYFDALAVVERERVDDVPTHLKDANRDKEGFGHGQGYLYPHAYRDHWVAQQYLPTVLQGRQFYQPSDQGYERAVRDETSRRREAQLAAMVESEAAAEAEALTFTGPAQARARDRWLARSLGDAGERLAALRDRLLSEAVLARHDRVLDLKAGTGLLTWEALRRAPEGGVWALAEDERSAAALAAGAARLGEVEGPTVIQGTLEELGTLLALRAEADVRFEAIVGRNALGGLADPAQAVDTLVPLLAPGGRLSLAETLTRQAPRPSSLLAPAGLSEPARQRLRQAEAEATAADPRQSLDIEAIRAWFRPGDWASLAIEAVNVPGTLVVTDALVAHWFGPAAAYAAALAAHLAAEEIERVRLAVAAHVGREPVPWPTVTAYATARRPA
jgi:putative ATPase